MDRCETKGGRVLGEPSTGTNETVLNGVLVAYSGPDIHCNSLYLWFLLPIDSHAVTTVSSPNTHWKPRPHSRPCSSYYSSNDFHMGIDVPSFPLDEVAL